MKKQKRAKKPWNRRSPKPHREVWVVPRDGGAGQAADGLYDDCPICQAMRAEGIVPDARGVADVSHEEAALLSLLMREVGSRAPMHRAS